MVTKILIIASAACVLNLANGSSAPFPGFHPCKTSDDECILDNAIKGVASFADGIPSLDVKRLDPISFKKLESSSPNLKLVLLDIILTGLKTCKPLKVKFNAAKFQLILVLQCALKVDGNYEMDGKMLSLPIKGNGKIHAYLKKFVGTTTINYFIKEGKDGKRYIRIKNFEPSYELKEKSDVVFDGLFQDNKVLSQAADDLIKNNANEIIQEIGGDIFKACTKEIVESINKFTEKLSYDEIVLD